MPLACSFFVPFFACDAPLGPRISSVSLDREPLDPGRGSVSLRFPPPTFVSLPAEFAHFLLLRFAAREVHSHAPKFDWLIFSAQNSNTFMAAWSRFIAIFFAQLVFTFFVVVIVCIGFRPDDFHGRPDFVFPATTSTFVIFSEKKISTKIEKSST